MTIEEFNKTQFEGIMICEYNGEKHRIFSVDYEEKLISITEIKNSFVNEVWKRCENIEICKDNQ